ncbi:MAG: DNA-formamidopyrimidine glycosylase family protein [Pseudomonadota bacterium]
MPEGDTLETIARFLRPRLIGQTLIGGRVRGHPEHGVTGERVIAIQAHGKHLFVRFRSGKAIRTHLGMTGSWHRYNATEPWKRPRRQATLILQTHQDFYVCFNAKETEVVKDGGINDRSIQARLGPDLSEPEPDIAAIVARAHAHRGPDARVIDVLLDQSVAAGIGNVYKSELLFIERIAPSYVLSQLDDVAIGQLYSVASTLIRRNLDGGPRVTRMGNGPRLWVYRRRNKPCLRCGAPISMAKLGEHLRSTYWCGICQPGTK